ALELQSVQDSPDGQSSDARGARRKGVIGIRRVAQGNHPTILRVSLPAKSERSSNHLILIEKPQCWWLLDAPLSRGMTILGQVILVWHGETAFRFAGNAFGVRDAAFSLLDFHLWRQRRADWRLMGSVEMVRGCGRRRHRVACGGQGRDLAAN